MVSWDSVENLSLELQLAGLLQIIEEPPSGAGVVFWGHCCLVDHVLPLAVPDLGEVLDHLYKRGDSPLLYFLFALPEPYPELIPLNLLKSVKLNCCA